MDVSLTDELLDFVQASVKCGRFESEEAVVREALERLRLSEIEEEEEDWLDHDAIDIIQDEPVRSIEALIDHEAMARADREGDETITFEEIRAMTSKDPSSWAETVIDEVRAEPRG